MSTPCSECSGRGWEAEGAERFLRPVGFYAAHGATFLPELGLSLLNSATEPILLRPPCRQDLGLRVLRALRTLRMIVFIQVRAPPEIRVYSARPEFTPSSQGLG